MDVFEKARLALRKRIEANPEKVREDLIKMKEKSMNNYKYELTGESLYQAIYDKSTISVHKTEQGAWDRLKEYISMKDKISTFLDKDKEDVFSGVIECKVFQ